MSAICPCTICSSASGAPNNCAARRALQRLVERAAGKAERRGADRGAKHVERRHRDLETVARRADQGRGWHAARSRNAAAPADAARSRSIRSAIVKTRIVAGNDEGRKPVAPGASPVRANTT